MDKEEYRKERLCRYKSIIDRARAIRRQIRKLENKLSIEERELQMMEDEYRKYLSKRIKEF